MKAMDKVETVARMAASIYAARPANKVVGVADAMFGRAAAQAWALYDAVEMESARRHSRQ
jgi:hypothetical protein